MKCVRCGGNTNSATLFCDSCQSFLKNDRIPNNAGIEVNWGYMLVTMSVVAVAIMLAMIVYNM